MSVRQNILVCGDVEGRFKALFNRVESINKKSGPFEMLLCVGNFFGVNNSEITDYRIGSKKVPVATYVLGANEGEHVDLLDAELPPNVYCLGKRGCFTSSGGLKIAYLSGKPATKGKPEAWEFDKNDCLALRDVCTKGQPNYRGVDILLTSQWPKSVSSFDENPSAPKGVEGSELVSWLALNLRPRYHIAGLEGVYYERVPYRNAGSAGETTGEIATRFLGLARVGNAEKLKWIYALSLTPVEKMRLKELYESTTDETRCPYEKTALEHQDHSSQFFYDMTPGQEAWGGKRRGRGRGHDHGGSGQKRPRPEFDQSKCWFCLASPDVEKHMVVSIGDKSYLALAKGGLLDRHLLILPIEHHQASLGLPEEVTAELQRFKRALRSYFDADDHLPVFFERNYKTSHLQVQAVPVPKKTAGKLRGVFEDEAEASGYKLEELDESSRIDQVIPEGAPYFIVELPTGETLYCRCRSGFPVQFGRDALCSQQILNLPGKTDWRQCTMPRDEEEKVTKIIRAEFEKHDFTL